MVYFSNEQPNPSKPIQTHKFIFKDESLAAVSLELCKMLITSTTYCIIFEKKKETTTNER